MKSLKNFAPAVLFAAMLPLAGSASAHWPLARVNVEVYDRTEGRALPMYDFGGRRYVVGKPGNEYAIRVRNNGGERALAVMSVDGVNVISGDTASTSQSGYVFGPGDSSDIAGWRTNMARTQAFYFTALPDSYAARTGRPDNVGVIGVAIFQEKQQRVKPTIGGYLERDRADASRRSAKADAGANAPERAEASADAPQRQAAGAAGLADNAASSAPASPAPPPAAAEMRKEAQAAQKLGTGYGRTENSYASYTTFQRASETPVETIAIYYDSYQNLAAMGVPVGYNPPLARLNPEPFPERGRFVPAPR